MAASLVRCKLRAKCPQILRLTATKPRRATSLALFCQQVALPSSSNVPGLHVSLRLFTTTTPRLDSAPTTTGSEVKAPSTENKVQPVLPEEEEEDLYRERYIPITRQSIIRHLVQEKEFLTDDERKIFPDFALALDTALVNKYHAVLRELKILFDPINPDKDTVSSREYSAREKLDNEFWLLQQLEDVMDKANFHELPKKKVERFLREHEASEGVRVSVDPNRYGVLRFWVLGREIPELQLSMTERIMNRLFRRKPRKAMEYFKRVVVAIRLKKDSKLILKAFKEVPAQNIEMLLPDGTIKMSTTDKGVLVTTGAVAGFGILAKAVTAMADLNMDWTLVLTLVTGAISFNVWTNYKNRRNKYLMDMLRILYFKNTANNRGLLTLLVDRAEDESLKEALLTYAFLLHSRPVDLRKKPSNQYAPESKGGLTDKQIEDQVELWVEKKTGVKLDFDSNEALEILKKLGLVSEKNDKYHALMLDAAMRILPRNPNSVIIGRVDVADATEGYDRDEYLETEEEYKAEEKKTSRYGWF